MAKTNTLIIGNDNLDELLGSTGYLLPSNELELLRFNKLYEDYEFKLAAVKIDAQSIIEGRTVCKYRSPRVIEMNQQEINELRMVARNGDTQVPDDIVAKMKAKHRKRNDGKE